MGLFKEREEDENDGIPVDLKQKVCPTCRRKVQPWEATCPEDGSVPVEGVEMGSVEDQILARLDPGLLADLDDEDEAGDDEASQDEQQQDEQQQDEGQQDEGQQDEGQQDDEGDGPATDERAGAATDEPDDAMTFEVRGVEPPPPPPTNPRPHRDGW